MSHGQRLGHVALPRRARAGDLVRTERADGNDAARSRSEEHTSELQSLRHLVCRLLLEKKKNKHKTLRHPVCRVLQVKITIFLHKQIFSASHRLFTNMHGWRTSSNMQRPLRHARNPTT